MRTLFFLVLVFFAFTSTSKAQTVIGTGHPLQLSYQKGGMGADSVLAIPFADTTGAGATWPTYRQIGRIMVNTADSLIYYHNGDKWVEIGGSGAVGTPFVQDGNAFGEKAVLGTTDNHELEIMANENVALIIGTDGKTKMVDGTQGNGKVIMSSADGTLSAQTADSVVAYSNAWINGNKNFGTTQSTLGATADTFSLRTGAGAGTLLMQAGSDGRVSFGDILRNGRYGLSFRGVGGPTGQAGATFEVILSNTSGSKTAVSFAANSPANVTRNTLIEVGRSRGTAGVPYIGIGTENWGAAAATTNYLLHSGTFQSSSTNWFLFGEQNVKSQLAGNLLLGGTVDNGYKLQVTGAVSIVNGDEGAGKVLTSSADGKINIVDPTSIIGNVAFVQDGNAFGEKAVLGTTDNHELEIMANETTALIIGTDGKTKMVDGTQGDGKVIMSSADGTLSAQTTDSLIGNHLWEWGKLEISGNIVTSPLLEGEISLMIFINEIPLDWDGNGVVHDPNAGTLNFTAIGGMQGWITFQYRKIN